MTSPSTIACPRCGLEVPAGLASCPRDDTPLAAEVWPEPTLQRAGAGPIIQTVRRDPLVGQTLGEYVVEALIGVGGMGLVYRGLQPMIGKPVAIKILRPEISDSPSHVERLLAEARAVNAVRHRGIIDIFNFGRLPDGRQYLVMEYLEGKALDEYILERGVLPPAEAVSLLEEISSALAAAHEAGVVHRDLKPNNIFLVKQSHAHFVKLLDFGLAKQITHNSTTPQTHAGLVVGTPEYMAPEQARGEAIGPKTDLYALGVVAFEMLTGRLPFHANSPMEFLVQHLEYAPPRVTDLLPELFEELSELVDQLLMKEPEQRPSSADQVRRELRRLSRFLPQDVTQIGSGLFEPPGPKASGGGVIVSSSVHARPALRATTPRTALPGAAGTTETQLRPPMAPGRRSTRATLLGAGAGALLLVLLAAALLLVRSPGGLAPAGPSASGERSVPPASAPAANPGGGAEGSNRVAAPAPAAAVALGPADRVPPAQSEGSVVPAERTVLPASGGRAAAQGPLSSAGARTSSGQRTRPSGRTSRETQLLHRIAALEAALKTRPRHPGIVVSARSMLRGARTQVEAARSAADYAEVSSGLDVWEARFLAPP